jgi:hypothetical protein
MYSNLNQAGFIAKTNDGGLALVFQGSTPGLDYASAALDFEDAYLNLMPLIRDFISYANDPANNITHIFVAGHSLGGELANMFAMIPALATNGLGEEFVGIGALDRQRFPIDKISVVTFGSPGIEPSMELTQDWVPDILNIFHTQDPVYNLLGIVFEHPGRNVPIDMPLANYTGLPPLNITCLNTSMTSTVLPTLPFINSPVLRPNSLQAVQTAIFFSTTII